mgnify:CR=1 FL=1
MTLLVTGGAGFIGGNFVLDWIAGSDEPVVNLDKLTYAGNLETLSSLQGNPRHVFVQGDIGDRALVEKLLAEHRPRAVINFAAESHVDRSIHGPGDFIETNIVGTYHLLESVRGYWNGLPEAEKSAFRFLHVSTDYVFNGELDRPYREDDPVAGAGGFEALTTALCERAWEGFQRIEAAGGLPAVLAAGTLQGEIAGTASERAKNVARAKEPL